MTGQTHLVTHRRGMELGADDFLVKPVSLGDLLRCVEARLDRAQVHWRVEDRMLTGLRTSLQSTLPHELFTPLGGIIGLADILRSDFPNLSPVEIKELLDDLHSSALRLHRTLRNYLMILDLQSNANNGAPVVERLDPKRIKENLDSGVNAAAHRNERSPDIRISVDASPIIATPGNVNLIAEELADNACKFSRPGTLVQIRFGPDGILTVTDTGRGMSPEEIAQVGSFQQFDRKKQEQQGLGLGLALVQKLTARCGGAFSIESRPAEGTTVKIAFKLAPPTN
jgi:signal transduction histidine kinase